MSLMRLDRFFSMQQVLPRREVRPLVRAGLIGVNGGPARSAEQKIDPEKDEIRLRGEIVSFHPHVYLMLNKPPGVVSATDDKTHATVLDLVPAELWRDGLFPAGRLDKDTTGFVLLTNDGDFAHLILSPKNHVAKTYQVRLDKPLPAEGKLLLESGVELADGAVCRAAALRLLEADTQPLWEIVIVEGKYHQIKRMFGVAGCGVNALKRVQIGGLMLDNMLPEGACRELSNEEVERILAK